MRVTAHVSASDLHMQVLLGNVVAGVSGPNMFSHLAAGLVMRFAAITPKNWPSAEAHQAQ